ncbi:MAG TPA: SDR family oxidoreductase [Actinophytocola sp.]|uniref:SDR family oxidoreductase n=1 Tax=Actinophytocola sp. TaxID=1872138 RepID=UPI002DDD78F2|nr:SDR family oxidoreductase [Actinophytocola sp.]HEV2784079.1 SDR family oxidoreductase [Actinophytocola sp.]
MIVVTGASGQLGRLVIEGLLERVPAERIVAAVRSPEKVAELADRGVQVRRADYDEPDTLPAALAGAERLLLISGDTPGQRLAQHRAVIDAAVTAGVGAIVYTSVLHADTSPLIVAPDHKATEDSIVAAGLPYTFLRNGWYTENYEQAARTAAETGVVIGSAGDGRVASATRADYAAAAVAVLTTDGHAGRIYELSGDKAWSYTELAAEIGRIAAREVGYRNLTPDEHRAALIDAGLPEAAADVYVSFDRDIAAGALGDTPGQLSSLIGRPTTPLAETLAAVLRT